MASPVGGVAPLASTLSAKAAIARLPFNPAEISKLLKSTTDKLSAPGALEPLTCSKVNSFSKKDLVVHAECGNVFNKNDIDKWFSHSAKKTCPLCRQESEETATEIANISMVSLDTLLEKATAIPEATTHAIDAQTMTGFEAALSALPKTTCAEEVPVFVNANSKPPPIQARYEKSVTREDAMARLYNIRLPEVNFWETPGGKLVMGNWDCRASWVEAAFKCVVKMNVDAAKDENGNINDALKEGIVQSTVTDFEEKVLLTGFYNNPIMLGSDLLNRGY